MLYRPLCIFVVCLGVAAVVPSMSQAEDLATRELRARIALHAQWWGQMGVDTAAHLPDTAPLPLKIGDTVYASGLGVHADAETVIQLDGQYLRFTCVAGVQQLDNGSGTVVMRVLLDGREIYNSGRLDAQSGPQLVDLDVREGGELRLVVEDADDGIAFDLANWAEARLIPDPDAEKLDLGQAVDIAPFGKVMSWDPAQVEGTKATRLEPLPAEDLPQGTELLPDAAGTYTVSPDAEGRVGVGLEWLERRRLQQVALVLHDAGPPSVRAEYWAVPEGGGSRWQGKWQPIPGKLEYSGGQALLQIDSDAEGYPRQGTSKIRFVFEGLSAPLTFKSLSAWTQTRWKDTALEVIAEGTGTGAFTLYNGQLTQATPQATDWPLGAPLRVALRYSPARLWELPDRTVLRFRLPAGSFGVAVDDVIKHGAVHVPHAGLLVRVADSGPTLESYAAKFPEKQTILEAVRALPDQTMAQAMERIHRAAGDHGPTMLSLACDNRKFIVERNGVMQWDPRPEVFDYYEKAVYEPYLCKMTPRFGTVGGVEAGTRVQEDWFPIQTYSVESDGMSYEQRSFVAPAGKDTAARGDLDWVRHRALGVAVFTVTNTTDAAATPALSLTFGLAGENTKPLLSMEGDRVVVRRGEELLAVVAPASNDTTLGFDAEQGTVALDQSLAPGAAVKLVVYVPRWAGAEMGDIARPKHTETLAEATRQYWRKIMAGAMQVEVPDPLLNKLIPASIVHCLLAARNEDGAGIAPWISSLYYGPFESESNAIVRALQQTGLEEFSRRSLEYYIKRYNAEGFLTTGYTVMGTGWHLWALGEYFALTRDEAWLRANAAEIARVCDWIVRERHKTMRLDAQGKRVPEYGMMPPGVMADWNVYAYYFYANGYYCTGLKHAAEALAAIDWPGAEALLREAEEFAAAINQAFLHVQAQAPVVPLRTGAWVPYYPTQMLAPDRIELFYAGEDVGRSWCYDIELGAQHLVPMGIMPPDAPAVAWALSHMEDEHFLRSGWQYYPSEASHKDWFNLGGFSKVQPYYSRIPETYAMRDEVKPFIRSYFNAVCSLVNREDLSLWEHFFNGAYNKTHETGYLIQQSRTMLVQERGDELWLAPFVTSNWLQDGMHVGVKQAPTKFGDVSYRISSHVNEGYVDVEVTTPSEVPPSAIVVRVRHPEGRRIARVEGAEATVEAEKEVVRLLAPVRKLGFRVRFE